MKFEKEPLHQTHSSYLRVATAVTGLATLFALASRCTSTDFTAVHSADRSQKIKSPSGRISTEEVNLKSTPGTDNSNPFSTSSKEETEPEIAETSSPVSNDQIAPTDTLDNKYIPLAGVLPTEIEAQTLQKAEDTHIANCMRDRGHQYDPASNDQNIAHLASLSPTQRADWATSLLGDTDFSNDASNAARMVYEKHGVNASVTWNDGSCVSLARSTIYEANEIRAESLLLETTLVARVSQLTDEDREYQTVHEQWRDCVTNHMDSQQLTPELPGFHELLPSLSTQCDQEVELSTAHRAAVKKAENTVLAENAASVTSLRRITESALDNALNYPR